MCSGEVVGIYLTAQAGAVPLSRPCALAVPGRGLEGDRYFAGCGTWSYERRLWSDLTLVESEALDAAAKLGLHIEPGEARRNLVTVGVALDELIGQSFRIGDVDAFGERTCDPCRHLDRLTSQSAKAALAGRGGLRARIRSRGLIRVGDPVVL
ncbi:MAG: MOSC domain-containing protein [Acidimicrobiales bacterium]